MTQCPVYELLSLRGQLENQAQVPQLVSLVYQRKTNLRSRQYFVYSALLSSFDRRLIRFQSFLELFLFSLNLSLKNDCFVTLIR